ncbi:hypothetical protein CEB3_c23260 [Peptococcaceae bacterium CEB3]|nr:hypothetical protein CEB3_c23260 [Peptococcaceae bacterium CEB3]
MIEIFTGYFGSGKTEIALNRAVSLTAAGQRVHVVDLDIVKPYFRSREARAFLAEAGVDLIMPNGGWEDADLPVVSPRVLGALTSAEGEILIDVGGDAAGALALAAFAPLLQKRGYRMFLVINPYRPFSGDAGGLIALRRDIEQASQLRIDGIVSNPNLGEKTEWEDLLAGYAQVNTMARDLDLPVLMTGVTERWAERLEQELAEPARWRQGEKPVGPRQRIRNYLLPPWESEEGQINRIGPPFH